MFCCLLKEVSSPNFYMAALNSIMRILAKLWHLSEDWRARLKKLHLFNLFMKNRLKKKMNKIDRFLRAISVNKEIAMELLFI